MNIVDEYNKLQEQIIESAHKFYNEEISYESLCAIQYDLAEKLRKLNYIPKRTYEQRRGK